jgi:preprotein translocase subunit YajC
LSKGDEIVTSSGILGKIAKVNDNFITLAITDSVEVVIQKSAVAAVMPKGTIKSHQDVKA